MKKSNALLKRGEIERSGRNASEDLIKSIRPDHGRMDHIPWVRVTFAVDSTVLTLLTALLQFRGALPVGLMVYNSQPGDNRTPWRDWLGCRGQGRSAT